MGLFISWPWFHVSLESHHKWHSLLQRHPNPQGGSFQKKNKSRYGNLLHESQTAGRNRCYVCFKREKHNNAGFCVGCRIGTNIWSALLSRVLCCESTWEHLFSQRACLKKKKFKKIQNCTENCFFQYNWDANQFQSLNVQAVIYIVLPVMLNNYLQATGTKETYATWLSQVK